MVSDLVVAEAYDAVHYHYSVKKGDALHALRRMFDDGEITSTGAAADVLAAPGIASARPGFVDRLIQRGYESAGSRMATFERASGRLPSVTIL